MEYRFMEQILLYNKKRAENICSYEIDRIIYVVEPHFQQQGDDLQTKIERLLAQDIQSTA